MKDRIPTKPGRVKVTREDGTWEYATLERADEPAEEGTPLNKATLLKDQTAEALGLTGGATPDDALNELKSLVDQSQTAANLAQSRADDTFTKAQTLTAGTAELLGLTEEVVPDDAFMALVIGVGKYGFKVHVQLPDGTPVSGVAVSGLSAVNGRTLVTDSHGNMLGVSTSANPAISAASPYVDISNGSIRPTAVSKISAVTLVLPKNEGVISYTSSISKTISPLAKSIDVCAVGGGAGGNSGRGSSTYGDGGQGGQGGEVVNSTRNAISGSRTLNIQIGSGGAGGEAFMNGSSGALGVGGVGGGTTVSVGNKTVSARGGGNHSTGSTGGTGGNVKEYSQSPIHGKSGADCGIRIFGEAAMDFAGAGGGGGGAAFAKYASAANAGSGGSPKGGAGGSADPGEAGKTPGGGGGGGYGYNVPLNGGAGGNGGVYVRFHF